MFQWLGNVVNICNKKLGTPFDRCQSVFDGAVSDCKAKLGPYLGAVCNLTYVVSTLCYVVKPFDLICMLVSYIADTVVGAVKKSKCPFEPISTDSSPYLSSQIVLETNLEYSLLRFAGIKRFTMHMKAMFYVKVKFSHSFHFETNETKTISEVSKGITTEIRARTDKIFRFFNFVNLVTSIFVFIIVLKYAIVDQVRSTLNENNCILNTWYSSLRVTANRLSQFPKMFPG